MLAFIAERLEGDILSLGSRFYVSQAAHALPVFIDWTAHDPEQRFMQTDTYDTPFQDNGFDFLVATKVVEPVRSPL